MTLTLRSLDAMAALDVCDVATAKLAVTKRLAGRGHVDHCLANRKFKRAMLIAPAQHKYRQSTNAAIVRA